ncbi:MAG: hypothetical protein K5750_05870 [Eubacterium sp.]|nr:hypothetical protein [Eubacterium sp.]
MEQVSFKTRVKNVAIENAHKYKAYYVDKDYLLISDAFHDKNYYCVKAEKDNYLHLLGVSTKLSAESFFDKCEDGSLSEDDFEIMANERDAKSVKGSIRRKINVLPEIFELMSEKSMVEESFQKNKVFCSIASANDECTLGFVSTPAARPKSLLKGNELNSQKSKPIKIILSKKRNEDKYDNLIVGSKEDLVENYELVKALVSKKLENIILSENKKE